MNGVSPKGLDLPERVRRTLASAVRERGAQARVVSTQGRESMRPPQGHVIAAATETEIEAIRGPARVVRQLEFYRTRFGPVVRLAFSVYPETGGDPFSAETLLNISQVSGEAALTGLGRQKSLYLHFYYTDADDLTYAFSKEITNAPDQRREAKQVHKMARDNFTETPADQRSFRWAVGLAEKHFELPVPEPEDEV